MDEREISRSASDLIGLVACALHNTAPDETAAGMDFDAVYRLAQSHSLTAIACMGLENGNAFAQCSPELVRKWKEAKEKAIRKNLILDSERQKILTELEKNGIWYMPLKGVVLKDLYPRLGMRQMADNDILFDASRKEEIRPLFEKLGFICSSIGKSYHDCYKKPPVTEFEMHRDLFFDGRFPAWAEKYKTVKSRLIADPGKEYGFHFSDEDFYVYITAHAYKHFANGGTGLRTLVDFYVYNWKKGAALNWEYIHSELESMGLADYERSSRRLAEKLFCVPNSDAVRELNEEEKELLSYYLGSGTYGTMTNKLNKAVTKIQDDGKPIRKSVKVKYVFSRLFPGMEWYRAYHPYVYRHPWLIPFFTIYRIVIRPFGQKRKRLLKELRAVLRLH